MAAGLPKRTAARYCDPQLYSDWDFMKEAAG